MPQRLTSGDAAPDVTLYAPDGSPVRTAHLWMEMPVVLAFQRHFG